jgi:outer membrane protein
MRLLALACLAAPLAAAEADRTPLPLSLKRAVEIAISPEGNTRIQLAEESVKQARSRSEQARAALLPDISAAVGEQNRTANLAAMGITISVPIPGFHIPTFVGPFTTFDARVSGVQTIFDFSSLRRFQASKIGVSAARSETRNSEDQVGAQVARAYIVALKTEADLEAVRANIALAEALVKQAQNQKTAGTGTGIEITRARVQLANEQQRLLVAQNERRKAHLLLLRAMGLRLDTEVQLTDKLQFVPVDAVTAEQAKAAALQARPDLKAQQEREDNARVSAHATKMERLPSLVGFADYGSIGTGMDHALPTRTYGVSLRVPVFDGGRRDARRGESASLYRQEHVRTADLKEQIELDIRTALDSLRSAGEQVKVAEEGLQLADNELAQARRRYEAGVANSLEVTDAQTRLERSRDNRIAALLNHNLARIDLALATGSIRRIVQ